MLQLVSMNFSSPISDASVPGIHSFNHSFIHSLKSPAPPLGYLGHIDHTPGSFSMPLYYKFYVFYVKFILTNRMIATFRMGIRREISRRLVGPDSQWAIVPQGIIKIINSLTPWLMEPGGLMSHSQGLSNNSYPESNQPNYPH